MRKEKLTKHQQAKLLAFNLAFVVFLGPILLPLGGLIWLLVKVGEGAQWLDDACSGPVYQFRSWAENRIKYGPKGKTAKSVDTTY